MSSLSFDAKWLLGIMISVFGAFAVWMNLQLNNVEKAINLSAETTLVKAKTLVRDELAVQRQELVTKEAFKSFATKLSKTTEDVVLLARDFPKYSNIVDSYMKLVERLIDRVGQLQQEDANMNAQIVSLTKQTSEMNGILKETMARQVDVRENLVPTINSRLQAVEMFKK